jgi:hypothetical protein
VLRTLYIGGCPLDGGHKVRGDPRQLPPRGGAGSGGRAPRCGERAAVRRKLIAFGAN